MGIFKRLFSVGTGLAAGVLAYKLLSRYDLKVRLEGEYRVVPPETEGEKEPAEAQADFRQDGPAQEAPAEETPPQGL